MPRRGSPYGPAYERARRRLLASRPLCRCGAPATQADHQPPLALHRHRDGSGCCQLVPACAACQARQGLEVMLARRPWRQRRPPRASRQW